MGNRARKPVAERFWSKVDRRGPNECWPWIGTTDHAGYGIFHIEDRKKRATRLSLELDGKPRPSPRHIACHTCDNPQCVNPAHLWWGTHTDNINDAVAKRRHHCAKKTHCPRGHPYSGDNVYYRNGGGRSCKACRLELYVPAAIRALTKVVSS